MAINRNNHAFKGHRTLLGTKYVTYGELELPLRYDLFALSKNGFDWGHTGLSAQQLAFSMLYQLTNEEFAKNYAPLFTSEIVAKFNNRDWVISGFDVLKWINKNTQQAEPEKKVQEVKDAFKKSAKKPKLKSNVVKEVCDELQITQKQLANILEIPEGTVSSWAVKNEIPRLGKKAIEFYTQSRKNQKIVDSYKSFVKLLDIS
ncbi:DUF6166 domain-containing protein [Sulfurimonas sp.]|uniref:DUF6166 domain-containing protein n=1 Tax=Sulfurimonas sp. TaxID=2022749 RepID=UPI00286DC64A|nr:DUF6166 domain-containing protein [Sulfurimonas sp.]